jgi:hypothetical protein
MAEPKKVVELWRLAVDFLDSSDIIMRFASFDDAAAFAQSCIKNGSVVERDDKDKEALWIYPLAQVRSFHVYKQR